LLQRNKDFCQTLIVKLVNEKKTTLNELGIENDKVYELELKNLLENPTHLSAFSKILFNFN